MYASGSGSGSLNLGEHLSLVNGHEPAGVSAGGSDGGLSEGDSPSSSSARRHRFGRKEKSRSKENEGVRDDKGEKDKDKDKDKGADRPKLSSKRTSGWLRRSFRLPDSSSSYKDSLSSFKDGKERDEELKVPESPRPQHSRAYTTSTMDEPSAPASSSSAAAAAAAAASNAANNHSQNHNHNHFTSPASWFRTTTAGRGEKKRRPSEANFDVVSVGTAVSTTSAGTVGSLGTTTTTVAATESSKSKSKSWANHLSRDKSNERDMDKEREKGSRLVNRVNGPTPSPTPSSVGSATLPLQTQQHYSGSSSSLNNLHPNHHRHHHHHSYSQQQSAYGDSLTLDTTTTATATTTTTTSSTTPSSSSSALAGSRRGSEILVASWQQQQQHEAANTMDFPVTVTPPRPIRPSAYLSDAQPYPHSFTTTTANRIPPQTDLRSFSRALSSPAAPLGLTSANGGVPPPLPSLVNNINGSAVAASTNGPTDEFSSYFYASDAVADAAARAKLAEKQQIQQQSQPQSHQHRYQHHRPIYHERQMSNGHVLVAEPDELAGFPAAHQADAGSEYSSSPSQAQTPNTMSAFSAAAMTGATNTPATTLGSVGGVSAYEGLPSWGSLSAGNNQVLQPSTNVGASHGAGSGGAFRKASRKLSLNAPMLGFGRRKDEVGREEKIKEEKEKERGGNKLAAKWF